MADAYRAAARTQAALVGGGSMRADLSAGKVTYQDVVDILPYSNNLIAVRVKGQTLLDALEFGVSCLPLKSNGFPQVSGLSFRVNSQIESSVKKNEKKQFLSVEGERRVSDVMIDGKALDPEAYYTLAMVDFLFTGGDGYTMFADGEIILDTMLTDNEAVIRYIEEDLGGVIPTYYENPQGRILIS